jgi:catechol 2,3-dioxygenase-like lactoylglutathione lyase family enzyme
MKLHRMDHVGINVEDLAAAKAFFLDLGLEVLGEMDMAGELVERVIGMENVKDRIVMLGVPGGAPAIELVQFHSPKDEQGIQTSLPNTLGMRHMCFAVDDVDGLVALLKEKHGAVLIGEIANYENLYKLCYLRGPEGIIVELAEKIGSGSITFE